MLCVRTTRIDVMFAVFSSIVLCVTLQESRSTECKFKVKVYNESIVTRNNKTNQFLNIFITIISSKFANSLNCAIKPTEVISLMSWYGLQENHFYIRCTTRMEISFAALQHENPIKNTYSLVSIDHCTFDITSMDLFLAYTNSRVLWLTHWTLPTLTGINETMAQPSCNGMNRLSSIKIQSSIDDIMSLFTNLFNCNDIFQEVKELHLSSCLDGAVNLEVVQKIFPTLQNLKISECPISGKLLFPMTVLSNLLQIRPTWTDVELIPTLFTRPVTNRMYDILLVLQTIPNIRCVQLEILGYVQAVTISNSFMLKLCNNSFSGATISIITLTNNSIEEIESGSFKGQNKTYFLDLSHNRLTSLPYLIFDDLSGLLYLNIGYNRLERFHVDIFKRLSSLETLILEHNKLSHISISMLPENAIHFRLLNLNGNTFTNFPLSVLYLKSTDFLLVDLQHTNISFQNFSSFLNSVNVDLIVKGLLLDKLVDFDRHDPRSKIQRRTINLTGCKVTGFYISDLSYNEAGVILVLLKYFRFNLTNNPIGCFSENVPFIEFMNRLVSSRLFTGTEYCFHEWLCRYPQKYQGKPLLLMHPDDTFYKIVDVNCPIKCDCYRWYDKSINIVDCNDKGLTEIPDSVPEGIVDLWIDNNDVPLLEFRSYFKDVRQLFASNISLQQIKPSVFSRMKKLEVLKIDHNRLLYLPTDIVNLKLKIISLHNNPLVCDCHTVWLKEWILKNANAVNKIKHIACETGQDTIETLISVPNTDFICKRNTTIQKHFIVPISVSSVIIVLMMLITLVVYIYRHEIKVLLYVKFELHPFDRRTPGEHENIDLTILHTNESLEFATNLGERLEEKGYKIKLAVRDFIAGYSILDNIKTFIYQSKHILLIISEDMLIDSSIVNWTWSECQYKFNVRSNFLIATSTCSNSVYNVLNTDFKKYLKLHQALKATSKLFFDKILYTISSYSNASLENEYVFYEVNRSLSFEDIEITTAQRNDIFVIFSDNERGFCRNELIPNLERKQYRVVSMDDINPGSNVMISIQEFVNDSIQAILVASSCQSVELDIAFPIVKMETLKRAYNYLIVVYKSDSGHTDNSEKTKEYIDFENYMDYHVYIKLQDEIQTTEEQNAAVDNGIDNANTEEQQSNARYEAFWEKLNNALQSSTLNPSRDNLSMKKGAVVKFHVGNCRWESSDDVA